jgi:hypothetical protein
VTLLTGAGAMVNGAAAERLHAALARCWALLRRAEMLPTAVCNQSTLVLNKHMHTHTHSFDGNCLQLSRVRDTLGYVRVPGTMHRDVLFPLVSLWCRR